MNGSPDPHALRELCDLAAMLSRLDRAITAAEWQDDDELCGIVTDARHEVAKQQRAVGDVVGDATALAAIEAARLSVARAVLAVDATRSENTSSSDAWRFPLPIGRRPAAGLGARVLAEVRHIAVGRPRAILFRVVITLAIALSLVAGYHLTEIKRYDLSGLTLYLFSAVVGSVICTNALCFDAERVRQRLADGDRMWQVLAVKNLAMALMITAAGLPVVAALWWATEVNPVALIDQLVTMVFIWLGVGNVLSVVYPLRHEPVTARLHDGTWKPYLFTFVISYGVGLTVNLTIYWRLWARQAANDHLTGGTWVAFILVLASSVLSWLLLTVFAVACSQQPALRRALSREMIPYRASP
ncbi:ABC transporter permease [Mycolicibacterium sarraceniae]|uniref:Uncharacterized protein n=1 Tax=Mycolicibacterium sarraceniae TaxID=1534348 RepID=A0A7I7STS1_9MYCO|nr:ABC transporter permease [Mycolicibacterium sarraceniae]BBY60402.1 hypothetical protein MSAR_35380 [Mycolicibacterium sarraceniae]